MNRGDYVVNKGGRVNRKQASALKYNSPGSQQAAGYKSAPAVAPPPPVNLAPSTLPLLPGVQPVSRPIGPLSPAPGLGAGGDSGVNPFMYPLLKHSGAGIEAGSIGYALLLNQRRVIVNRRAGAPYMRRPWGTAGRVSKALRYGSRAGAVAGVAGETYLGYQESGTSGAAKGAAKSGIAAAATYAAAEGCLAGSAGGPIGCGAVGVVFGGLVLFGLDRGF